jgi:hypothetical protein
VVAAVDEQRKEMVAVVERGCEKYKCVRERE